VAVKIKLKRLGKIRAPYYRIIVADARTKRDGRAIEEIGKYHPKDEPSLIEVDSERAQHWLSVGAQPTDPVRKILEITGDWQKFKGLPGEGTLRRAEPKADRKAAFAAAVAETLEGTEAKPKTKARSEPKASAAKGDSKSEKPPARTRKTNEAADAAAKPAAEKPAAAQPAAEESAVAQPAAEETAAAEPAADETAVAQPAAEETAAAEPVSDSADEADGKA
jgi:small subunit ribosomal protein S16